MYRCIVSINHASLAHLMIQTGDMIHTRIASIMESDSQMVISSETRATSELSEGARRSVNQGYFDMPEWNSNLLIPLVNYHRPHWQSTISPMRILARTPTVVRSYILASELSLM